MNVDLQEMDWGSVVQRRTSRESVDKGGWSIFHTTGSSPGYSNPAVSTLVRGQGGKGWFGWWDSPLGMFYTKSAYRSDLSGMLEGPAPYPWNLRRA